MHMIVVLAGVVEERRVFAVRAGDNLLQRLPLERTAGKQLIAGVDVGLVMLIVVVLERLARHVRRQRVVGIGKRRKRERHRGSPSNWGADQRTERRGDVS